MVKNGLSENGQYFLAELYRQTEGEPDVQVSMYAIGEAVEIERDQASSTAEELFGRGFAEVKTLSGGIGITGDGVAEARKLGFGSADRATADPFCLGPGPLLNEAECRSVEQVAAGLKILAGERNWDFETLTELGADLKTIDAQMASPKPKTPIIKECFRSIQTLLGNAGDRSEILHRINRLLGG